MPSLASLIIIAISSVSLAQEAYQLKREDLPAIGEAITIYLGDQMMEQRIGYYGLCVSPREKLEVLFERLNLEEVLLVREGYSDRCGRRSCVIPENGMLINSPAARVNVETERIPYRYFALNFTTTGSPDYESDNKFVFIVPQKNKYELYAEVKGDKKKIATITEEEFLRNFVKGEKYSERRYVFNEQSIFCQSGKGEDYTGGTYASWFLHSNIGSWLDYIDLKRPPVNDGPIIKPSYSSWQRGDSEGKDLIIQNVNNKWIINEWRSDKIILEMSAQEFQSLFKTSMKHYGQKDKLQRQIEYVGKEGSVLNFLYTESFRGSLDQPGYFARPASSRSFIVDLSEGKVGGFKGALFEVINATNAQITYKMLRHFP